jgi:adenylosuccinate lyase
VGREAAHEAIQEHAVAVALAMREDGASDNDLLDRLADDDRLPLDRAALDALVEEPLAFVGTAVAQVEAFVGQVGDVVVRHPDASRYRGEAIL